MAHDFKKFPELTNRQMELYYFDSPHKQITEDFTARVTKVIDGDTIKVSWEERDFDFPIRFIDIAAPELKEEGGLESKNWLEGELLGNDVDIGISRFNRVGKFGRILGKVFNQGRNMGDESIRFGFSRDFDQKDDQFIDIDKLLELKI